MNEATFGAKNIGHKQLREAARITPAANGPPEFSRSAGRQSNPELRAAGDRLDLDVPVMLGHDDAPGDGESESGALAYRLCSEERLKYPVPDLRRHPGPGIADDHAHMVSVQPSLHGEHARLAHRRHRVVDQVGP